MAEPGSEEVEEVEEKEPVEAGEIKRGRHIQTDGSTSGPLKAHAATEGKTKKTIIRSTEAIPRRCLSGRNMKLVHLANQAEHDARRGQPAGSLNKGFRGRVFASFASGVTTSLTPIFQLNRARTRTNTNRVA
jgi:hypothetical protein